MHFIVFGAAGHIGSAVCNKLSARPGKDNTVSPWGRNIYDVAAKYGRVYLPSSKSVDAIIYCVGHCPPGGFLEAVTVPLSQYSPVKFRKEIGWHIEGPFNVFQEFLPTMRDGGHMVFMSSAITRILHMPRATRPLFHPYHHIAVIAAEDALIEGMRMDPEVIKRGIKIHKIMPPAISDSPFHKTEIDTGPRPSVTVTTDEVVAAIMKSLLAFTHEDVLLLPAAK